MDFISDLSILHNRRLFIISMRSEQIHNLLNNIIIKHSKIGDRFNHRSSKSEVDVCIVFDASFDVVVYLGKFIPNLFKVLSLHVGNCCVINSLHGGRPLQISD